MLKRSFPYILFILLMAIGSRLYPYSIQTKETILRADQLLRDGNPSAALRIYNELIHTEANLSEIYAKAGTAAYQIGDLELARYYLEQADSENMLPVSGKLTLGEVYFNSGDVKKAETVWRQIQSDPTIREAVSERLVELDIRGNFWDQAKKDLDKWITSNPNNERPRELLGWVTLFMLPQDALQLFQDLDKTYNGKLQMVVEQISSYQGIENDAGKRSIWWNKMGDLAKNLGENEFSLKSYTKAIETDPNNSIALVKLALEKQNNNLDGTIEVDKALVNGADNPFVNKLIADYWLQAGKPELSLIYLHKVIELDQENAYALNRIGWLLSDIGNVNEGFKYIKQGALILDSSEGWMNVIQYCLNNGIYLREEAIPAARIAINLSPESPEVLDLAGQVFFSQDDLVTAERYFLKAVSLKPDQYNAHLFLGYIYLQQGRYDLAREHLKIDIEQLTSMEVRDKAIQAFGKLPVE